MSTAIKRSRADGVNAPQRALPIIICTRRDVRNLPMAIHFKMNVHHFVETRLATIYYDIRLKYSKLNCIEMRRRIFNACKSLLIRDYCHVLYLGKIIIVK